ncbi:glucosamine--fructose-6-phosphate aminotransferase [Falsiroseomonas bella]|uniref:Glutamine--fructose-6-phosphate aminotransferase [isomerizing] n=1 Tax=Falsiroseomonas bella TaxID=2184016 RepID=A0A317FLX9_9PROT|nr:SIS domain-containing protein [Falsiroseomonas bella]PWS38959.1 glucosamine--fructose-6-phosphate aminotransferase [Falsiroseomonas bella]
MSPDPRFAKLRAEPSTDAPRDPARLARVERTRVEMLAQGEAIAATLAQAAPALGALAARVAARPVTEVVIAGCGDSWQAGRIAAAAFRARLGVPACGVQALDWALYEAAHAGPGTLVFGISSSGTTPAVLEALDRAHARGALAVGVTNSAGSPLHQRFDAALLVQATRRGWPTQATTATIALLVAAAEAIRPDASLRTALAALPEQADRLGAIAAAPMQEAGAAFARAGFLAFSGAGPFHATAEIGAAKIRELGPVHAVAWPLEELHHYRAQKHGDPLVLIAPDVASRSRALDAAIVGAGVGGRTLALLGSADAEIASLVERHLILPAAHPLLMPLLATIPLHHLAHAYAVARAEAGLGYPGA